MRIQKQLQRYVLSIAICALTFSLSACKPQVGKPLPQDSIENKDNGKEKVKVPNPLITQSPPPIETPSPNPVGSQSPVPVLPSPAPSVSQSPVSVPALSVSSNTAVVPQSSSVDQIEIKSDQLVVTGSGLAAIRSAKLQGSSVVEFNITNKSETSLTLVPKTKLELSHGESRTLVLSNQ